MATEARDRPELKLTGVDGNAFSLLGEAHQPARRAGWSRERWARVREEATSGDYDNLLATLARHFEVT